MSVIKRRRKTDDGIERDIVTGMIVSDEVLNEIITIYDPQLMEIPYARMVANWCIDYHAQYGKAPKVHIQDLFKSHKRKELDEDVSDLIEDFLQSVSEEFERSEHFNSQYLLDQAEKRFKSKSLEALAEDMKTNLTSGEPEAAEGLLVDYQLVSRPTSGGINPLTDKEAAIRAYESSGDPLFKFPGALGYLMNEYLVREGLVSFMGPEKRGKTWWLMESTIRGLRYRNNVAFFGAGDMSENEMLIRNHIRIAGKSDVRKYCGRILVPVLDCVHNQNGSCDEECRVAEYDLVDGDGLRSFENAPRKYMPCSACKKNLKGTVWYKVRPPVEPLTWREGLKATRKFAKRMKGRDYKLKCYPNDTLTVPMMEAQLNIWNHFEGFVPDIIVVDYADILDSDRYKDCTRDQQNHIWKNLRRLAQERHALVITATQSDAASYETTTLKTGNFSEDKRKFGHATVMFGLNQTEEEKIRQICRINTLVARSGDYHQSYSVNVLQSLKQGRPCLASF